MIEDPWQSGKESLVPLYFRPPFLTVSKMQTALTKKFLQVCLQANYENMPVFQVKNPSVRCDQTSVNFRLINPPNEVLVRISPLLSTIFLARKMALFCKDFVNSIYLTKNVFETESGISDFML